MNSLCALARDWGGKIPDGGVMAERKWDGYRCLWARGRDGKPRLWTRQGMPIEGCDHIAHRCALIEEAAGRPLFLDGELVVDGTLAATKAWVEAGWKRGGEAGVLHLFDEFDHAEWERGGTEAPLYQRKALLAGWVAQAADPWEWRAGSRGRDDGREIVTLIADEWVADQHEALAFARRIWAEGGEGAMLKVAESPYRRVRSDAWAKVKLCNSLKWGAGF